MTAWSQQYQDQKGYPFLLLVFQQHKRFSYQFYAHLFLLFPAFGPAALRYVGVGKIASKR